MAIKIPSKNIYQIDNNKVIDNKIGELTIEENLDAFFEETIYSTNFNFWQQNNKGEYLVTGHEKNNDEILQFFPYRISDLRAYDNVTQQNEIKAEILDAINENTNSPYTKKYYSFYSIKFPIEQQINKNTLKVVFNTNYGTIIDNEFQFVSIKGSALVDEWYDFDEWYNINCLYSPEVSLNFEYAKIKKYTNKEDFIETYLTKNADNSYTVSNVGNYNAIIGLNQKEYEIEVYLLLKTDTSDRIYINDSHHTNIIEELVKNFNLRITAEVLKQEKNVISILQNEKNKTFKLQTNELLQAENTYKSEKLNTYVANKILSSYKDGKETAILLCDLDNYYDFESGVKVIDISGEKKTFDIYDKVIPTVLDINGTNKPISYHKNDTALFPKEFQVLKHKIIYNGMLKQELQCQETELGKDNYLIYEINFTVGRYNQNESDKGAKFKIKGKGDIYINDIFYNSFDYSTAYNIKIPYENINAETANFKFLGNFSQISTTSYNQTAGDSAYPQGKFNSVVQWDSRYFKTFEEQFIMQTLSSDFEIPSNITTISAYTFSEVKSQYLITIPKSVKTIEKKAFAYNGLTSIKFLHGENDTINLPTAGDINGAFYSKNAYNLTIYTDNLMIKNYDWATDNVTPTFYHLDGTLWE